MGTIKKDIRKLDESELKALCASIGEPAYRASQLKQWIWQKGAISFDQMTNLSKTMRSQLSDHYQFYPAVSDLEQNSSDGTLKVRFKLHDDQLIESVLIPVPRDKRYTVCVSSQVGCSLSCKFCATGKLGLLRQLEAAEIFDQVRYINDVCEATYDRKLSNIVFMGMGEPLLNYREVLKAINYVCSQDGLGFSPRRITLSTAGIAKMIKKLADDEVRFNLALSLHAPTDAKRNEIMPINESNNLAVLIEALEYFYGKTRNKISFEYIALRDFNDDISDARELLKLCRHFPVHVNIIEYNPIGDGLFQSSDDQKIDQFAKYISNAGVMCSVRRSRGKDIDAACGQLANK
jgi:23S rRNA (adenine2503-C2)-methyltransferase